MAMAFQAHRGDIRGLKLYERVLTLLVSMVVLPWCFKRQGSPAAMKMTSSHSQSSDWPPRFVAKPTRQGIVRNNSESDLLATMMTLPLTMLSDSQAIDLLGGIAP